MIRKLLIGLIVIVLLSGVSLYVYNYFNSVSVKLTIPNTSSIIVKQGDRTISKTTSDQTINFRAPKFSHITISFMGTGIYESSTRSLTIEDKSVVKTIKPYYSKDELKRLATGDDVKINNAISTYNPVIKDLYSVDNITLYHFGEWASAILIWRGSESANSDTLHIVLNKKNGGWEVIYQPNILLFRDYYKEVPIDILKSINNS